MKLLNRVLWGLVVVWLAKGTKVEAFMTHLIPGHEYLTLFALEQLQASPDPLTRHFYGTPVGSMDRQAHPLFNGNTLVDFPGLDRPFAEQLMQILVGPEDWDALSQAERDELLAGMIRHDDNRSQITQFTRNYLGDSQEESISAHESCGLSHNFIKDTIIHGVASMAGPLSPQRDSEIGEQRHRKMTGLKFIGAALHTLQDSFSKAHTQRHPDTWLIEDICSYRFAYFGRNRPSGYSVGCVHTHFPFEEDFGGGSLFIDDQVWDRGQTGCEIGADGQLLKSFACLKDETQMAVIVTRDLLALLVPFLNHALWHQEVLQAELETTLTDFLQTYHPDPALRAAGQGIMSCDRLADFSPHTRFDTHPPEIQPVTIDFEPVPFQQNLMEIFLNDL
ncbi:hypothetical protein AWQ21_10115 [Picosynechococcus sp. PCC 7003]|uniref:hypothetical protein n=1 Tax=Picosynechococcus sp. PCC 7003 TaxID=374981 RepID=UPI0008103B61|nr:hypothetical protein [Picosynechococcus sp. PCC 7003]ANV84706.1 hypothetical protein AWQ21_10115 [Picosynechococcus sp. PCC 7003]